MPQRSCSTRFIRPIKIKKNTSEIGEEFFRRVSNDYAAVKRIIYKTNPADFQPIEKAINWNNINALEQNKVLEEIISQQHQIAGQIQEL